jgi:hypothetical protein
MSLVAERLPVGLWQRALLPWFSQLCRDNNWRVRRAAALDLPRLAGKLHRHQAGGGGGCRGCGPGECCVCSACGARAGCCLSEGGCAAATAAPPRCRVTGVGAAPLGDAPTGGCAHIGGGADAGDARHSVPPRHQQQLHPRGGHRAGAAAFASSSAPSSAWAAPFKRASVAAGGMGKHPLSSSLLVDPPALDSPGSSESSSLSSSDESPDAPSPGALRARAARADERGACAAAAASAAKAGAATATPAAAEEPAGGAAAAPEGGDGAPAATAAGGGGAETGPPCGLAESQPELHACWAALRACVDCVTADSSHWVKVTALSGLGPCLLALPPCQLSGQLLGRFVAMGSSTTVIYEISVALACAQSLGAVASRMGPQRWEDVR